MTLWIDAQLSPYLALWINENFLELNAKSVRSLNLRDASDNEIFWLAREANAIIVSKDYDFVRLLEQHGSPPKLIWITCGNTSNARMCDILRETLPQAIKLLKADETIVELSTKW